MKKNILNVIIIALVISVVGTLATSLLLNGGNVLASPSVAPKNANECTIDNTCEVNFVEERRDFIERRCSRYRGFVG